MQWKMAVKTAGVCRYLLYSNLPILPANKDVNKTSNSNN